MVFISELQRMINKQVTWHTTTLYSSRLCVITKSEFKYYKSKESYLRMQKPLRSIPINSIIEVDFVKANKKGKTLDHFYIKIEDNTNNLSKMSEKIDICLDRLDTSRNHTETIKKQRKIKLVNQKKDNVNTTSHLRKNFSENFIENYENEEKILIFSSDKEELVKKWVTVLNYFIN
jgi:hypothetical protein